MIGSVNQQGTHGWIFRSIDPDGSGKAYSKYFSKSQYGTHNKARAAAIAHQKTLQPKLLKLEEAKTPPTYISPHKEKKLTKELKRLAKKGNTFNAGDVTRKIGVGDNTIRNRIARLGLDLTATGKGAKRPGGGGALLEGVVEALDEFETEWNKWKKYKFYPADLVETVANKHNLNSYNITHHLKDKKGIEMKVSKSGMTALDSDYIPAAKEYVDLSKKEKQVWGMKDKLLGKTMAKPGRFQKRYFSEFLKKQGLLENEIKPVSKGTHGQSSRQTLEKVSQLTLEDALSGQPVMGKKGVNIIGKKGEKLIHKGHLVSKVGEMTPGDMGYLASKLNVALGWQGSKGQFPEKYRDTLEQYMLKIGKNYKNKELYNISTNADSIDQTRFKNALIREFGKTSGKVPYKQYVNKIVNEEAKLIGLTTDGLITARQLDPITGEFAPGSAIGRRPLTTIGYDDPEFAQKTFKDIYKSWKAGDVTDVDKLTQYGNEAFQNSLLNTRKNLTKGQAENIAAKIRVLLEGGLQNVDYEEILRLQDLCRHAASTGGRVGIFTSS